MKLTLLAITAAALAAGCSMPITNATDTPRLTKKSALPSETAYRRIVGAARECYAATVLKVEADYFPEAKDGVIKITRPHEYGGVDIVRYTVKPDGPGSTIELQYSNVGKLFIDQTDNWLAGTAEPCPMKFAPRPAAWSNPSQM